MNDMPNNYRTASAEAFDRLFGRLRDRRRLRHVLRGLLMALTAGALCTLLATLWMSISHFEQTSVYIGRYAAYSCAGVLFAVFVLRPLLRRVDDMQCALQIERQTPQLDGLLLSAVAMRRLDDNGVASRNTSAELADDVLRRVVRAGESAYRLTKKDDLVSLRTSGILLALLLFLGVAVSIGPPWLQHGLRLVATPFGDPAVGNPFYFDVSPGDTQRSAGEDQLIIATARGFSPQTVTLFHRNVNERQWQQLPMQGDREDFTGYIHAVSQPLEYFVLSGGARSPSYRIDVVVPPALDRIDLTYHYPEYLGRAPQTVRDAGDIRAPRGTQVEIQVHVTNAPDGGRLVFDGDTYRMLKSSGDSAHRSAITVQSNSRYRVELVTENGQYAAVSPEFSIEVLEDAPPTVALRSPGRDAQVSSLEEVDIAVDVADDIGVRELELVLSINGSDEEVVPFPTYGENPQQFQAIETLFLEDRALQPGDLIAYYARARDAIAKASRPEVVTDIFFMEVRPFEREYHADNQSGGGGGGGQQQEQLAAQQRMLVVALYNAVRDRHKLSAEEHRLKLGKIADAQARIRARVDAIVRRLEARGILQLDPGYRQMTVELPKAGEAMREVEAELQAEEGRSAQTPARTALLHLQRAEAAFRSVRVARGDAFGDDSGDLRNLFRLEMDRFRNQYADVRRGQWQADAERIDKTLEQLRELARRQQREVERARLRSERGVDDGADSQRALAQEVERMARELQRLSLQNPELRELTDRLRRAAETMQAAADSNVVADSQEALRELREARRRLRASGPQRLARDIEKAASDARALQSEHDDVTNQMDRAQHESDLRRALSDRKRAMLERLAILRSQLKRLSQQAQGRATVGRELKSAGRALDQHRVAENIEHTQRLLQESLPADKSSEKEISDGLRAARERLESAVAGVESGNDEPIARAREQLRDVVRSLAAMSPGSANGFGGGDNWRGRLPGDSVNLREALRAHADVLRDLRTGLVSRPKAVGNIDEVIAGLSQLAEDLQNSDNSAARHARLLEVLQEADYSLRDNSTESRQSQNAFAPRHVQPDTEHRQIVEAYYRALSESARE
ncbi:MAG: hypothetical protein OES09_01560 [Gammaproteobacteria bacterium]|nr:hypothetical protein [Gammaproteobacteria bacterium]